LEAAVAAPVQRPARTRKPAPVAEPEGALPVAAEPAAVLAPRRKKRKADSAGAVAPAAGGGEPDTVPDLEQLGDVDVDLPELLDAETDVDATAGAAPFAAPPAKKKRKRRDPIEELRKRRARERRKLLLAAGEDPDAKPKKKKRKKRRTDEMVRPSPPLQQTDPMKHYLAGEMVPCPVGCGAFSEVVRISTREDGSGEVWFECLSCAQRRQFTVPAATAADVQGIRAQTEAGQEAHCLRHGERTVPLRRRGAAFVCPECGVAYDMS
jgi:hypothetical protein